MKRRICLLGATLGVALLVLSAAVAVAASSKKSLHSTCRTNTSVLPPAGQSDITPPATNGTEYGTAKCGSLGKGAQGDAFKLADSGYTYARFVWYLGTGTIHGKYELIPSPGATFTSEDFTGTLKVTGGTGAYKGAKGKGRMTCATPDNVHTSCVDKIKLSKL